MSDGSARRRRNALLGAALAAFALGVAAGASSDGQDQDPTPRPARPNVAESSRRASLGSPRMMCQSRALTDAALTRTSTSPWPGTGVATSSTRRTLGEP